MGLHAKIQAAIESNPGNAAAAALAICVLLDDEIGLAGNGWFDDDQVVQNALEQD